MFSPCLKETGNMTSADFFDLRLVSLQKLLLLKKICTTGSETSPSKGNNFHLIYLLNLLLKVRIPLIASCNFCSLGQDFAYSFFKIPITVDTLALS